MKFILLLLITFLPFHANAQVSVSKQRAIDSLYNIAKDKSNTIETRLKAYSRCSWSTVYQDYNQGVKISSEYLNFAKANGQKERIARASHLLGYSQMMLGQFEAANKTYQQGLEVALENDYYQRIGELYGDLGNLKNKLGLTNEAIKLHTKSLKLSEEKDLYIGQARAKINLGQIYEAQGNYKLSLNSFLEALSICNEKKLNGYKSSIYENLGDVNLTVKEYETSEKHFKDALKYAKQLNNSNREMQSLRKLGKLNEELNNLSSAFNYYEKALKIAINKEARVLEAKLRSDIANIRLKQKNFDESLEYVTESIELFKENDVQENLDETYLIAAELYLELNQKKLSKNYYQKSYEIAKETKNINALKNASKGLAIAFEEYGNNPKSINYYKEFIQYSNQIRNEDDVKEIIRLELQDKYREKTIADSISKIGEIKLLQAEYDKKEAQSNLKSYIAYSGIGVLSLGLLFVGYSFVQKRKIAGVLTNKNQIISQALSDNKILLKEVHHRVKNNMQVVSSLLQLKSKHTDNELAKEALLDSQKRIDSMRLAHQRMYQKGNYEQIDIIEYCNDIVRLLLHPIEKPQDSFMVNGETLWINVEQAQALGFIIHELIANSIKHAWDKKQPKLVEISISKLNDEIQFGYSDNGKGLPNNFDIKTTKSFGMKLIHSLATRQLLGKIDVTNIKGFHTTIKFDAR